MLYTLLNAHHRRNGSLSRNLHCGVAVNNPYPWVGEWTWCFSIFFLIYFSAQLLRDCFCSKLHWCCRIVTWQSLLSSCEIGGGRLWSTRRCHKVGTVCQWQALSPCKQANGGQIFVFVKLVNGQWSLEELSNQTDMLKMFWRLGPGLEGIGGCLKFSVKIFPTVSHVVKFHYFAVYEAEILKTNRLKKR